MCVISKFPPLEQNNVGTLGRLNAGRAKEFSFLIRFASSELSPAFFGRLTWQIWSYWSRSLLFPLSHPLASFPPSSFSLLLLSVSSTFIRPPSPTFPSCFPISFVLFLSLLDFHLSQRERAAFFLSFFFFFFFWPPLWQVEVPKPGTEPRPQQGTTSLQWQCWILNLLSHVEPPWMGRAS